MSSSGPHIRDNSDGTITVQYQPKEVGRHEVLMEHNGAAVNGSPFQCVVDSVGGGYVTAFGKGLVGGQSGESVDFTVVAIQGHSKDLTVNIDGPGKVDLSRKDNPDGSINFSFRPMTPGAYSLNIKYNGKHIKGSPFTAKVSGEGRKRSQLSLGNSSEYNLKIVEANSVNLSGSMKLPDGTVEPIILKKLGDGELGIASFNPKKKGAYKVNIYHDEKPIKGSPYTIDVGDKELGHAAKVHVTGAVTDASANSPNTLEIDTSNAGYGGLSVAIEGGHRSEIDCIEVNDRKYTIQYAPHEPGIYILNIRFADEHIPGSPFLLDVKGNPSGRIRETVQKQMEAAEASSPGKQCTFILKIPGTNPFDMEASITNPDGQTELCDVVDEDDFHYLIHFKPDIEGTHILSVKHKGVHVAGSPFPYSVGHLSQGGAHKVQAGGPGLERGEVGTANDFNIYTREAGPGNLSISIEGSSKSVITLEDRPNGSLGCSYSCKSPGKYGIHIKFDDQHIPGSPFILNVAPDSGEAKSVSVHSLKDRGLQIDKPTTFSVNLNGASGTIHATIRSPTGGHEDCFIQEMDKGCYAVRFIPKENGVHYIDIRLNDAHIPDSPFAIMVGQSGADPALIIATGNGLETGKCSK
ncbi:filamin-A [Patella vulgata]|uniref:filamin-A n=1 Tax=Patella vulgata TaxID=6465 RepID=UPI00217FFE13|nr:filamin-A [Patella vulgata]